MATADRKDPEMSYNGWTNYETWAVALWIDNEEPSYLWARGLAEETQAEWLNEGGRDPAGTLADALKDELEDAMPDLGGTLWDDLLGAAFGEVDWYEVARHYLDELVTT